MTAVLGMLRRQLAGVIALVVVVGFYFVVMLPNSSAEEKSALAKSYAFSGHSLALRSDGTDFPNNVISNDFPTRAGHGFGVNVWSTGSQLKVEYQDGFESAGCGMRSAE